MQRIKIISASILFLFFAMTRLQAQETLPASGGNASGAGGTASYSVGQFVYTANTWLNGSVAQGVQQPYEISVVTGAYEVTGIDLIWSAYPNPATDHLKLKVESNSGSLFSILTYSLYDVSGNLLESKNIEGNETTIATGDLASSVYFIKVYDKKNEVIKTFKIIKN